VSEIRQASLLVKERIMKNTHPKLQWPSRDLDERCAVGRLVCHKHQLDVVDDAKDNCIVSNEVENTNDKPYNR
jgi:hypothetical protein